MTISLYGGTGFVGGRFYKMFDNCSLISRNDRKPQSKEILYFISTVDNYNIHENITLDVDTNLKILCEVLDHCRDNDITFNFISSWFVYGKNNKMPCSESDLCNPTGFYSITKKCAEDLIISFSKTYGMKYRILRLCNVLGSGDSKVSKKKNAITWMIDEMKQNRDIDLYNGGKPVRDIMHVDDVCRAIKIVIDKGQLNQVYNVGSGKPTSIGSIIKSAHSCLNSQSVIGSIHPPEFHKNVQSEDFWMDTTKLKSLGFTPKINLNNIIQDLCL